MIPIIAGGEPMAAGIQVTSMVLTFLTTLGVAWIGYLTATAKARAEAAADQAQTAQRKTTEAVQTVTETLATTVAQTKETLAATVSDAREALAVTAGVTATRLDALATVTRATHILVNSNYGMSLLATLNALKAVQNLTHDPSDKRIAVAAVTEAQRLYDDHVAKQAQVDVVAPMPPVAPTDQTPRPIRAP